MRETTSTDVAKYSDEKPRLSRPERSDPPAQLLIREDAPARRAKSAARPPTRRGGSPSLPPPYIFVAKVLLNVDIYPMYCPAFILLKAALIIILNLTLVCTPRVETGGDLGIVYLWESGYFSSVSTVESQPGTIQVQVTGLSGVAGALIVKNTSNTDTLSFIADGIQSFTTILATGNDYHVIVDTQPTSPPMYCAVSNGAGTLGADGVVLTVNCSANPRWIFVTDDSYTGSLGGVDGADTKCNNIGDGNHPGGGVYKALIMDGANRVACTSVNCTGGFGENVDWVLAPNFPYVRADDLAQLFTTNEKAIFLFGTLPNVLATDSTHYWSGLTNNWRLNGVHCLGWATASGGQSGDRGDTNKTDNRAIDDNPQTCDSNNRLLCVEQ